MSPFLHEVAQVARSYAVPRASVGALLLAGAALGALGDALFRVPPPFGLNASLWIAAVAAAALALSRRAALPLDRVRVAWLSIGVLVAAGFSWRDAPALKLLALASATLAFAFAAHRPAAGWIRRAGVTRYAGALALGAAHVWTAATLAIVDAIRFRRPRVEGRTARWGAAAAVARGLALAAPLVAIFAALFVSADAAFEHLVTQGLRFDIEPLARHAVLLALFAWLSTGYLRAFLSGTDLRAASNSAAVSTRPALGATEVASGLAAINLLFPAFVLVQAPYLFGAASLVQGTPDLTYADYARRGFFELVAAVALVVPILLAAEWLGERWSRREVVVFRLLAAAQIVLVLAIAASALHRLRLYHAIYGLTESRFYAMALLAWMILMLLWLGATVLCGRRDRFAFGTVTSGLATIALLFAVSPDAIVARTNVARIITADAPIRFDAAYAMSLSADAVPILIDALPVMPPDVQCPLARHLLRRWPPDRYRWMRSWNWSAARAADLVRAHEGQLRAMVGPDLGCAAPAPKSRPALR